MTELTGRKTNTGILVNPMVTFDDLHTAFLFVSGNMAYENAAYLCRATGEIYYTGPYADDKVPIPDDLDDPDQYICIPSQHDLDLGQALIFKFVTEMMPDAYDQVRQIFSRKGAYRRFKDLLDRREKLDLWYQYEEQAVRKTLLEWCEENGVSVSG